LSTLVLELPSIFFCKLILSLLFDKIAPETIKETGKAKAYFLIEIQLTIG
jgi:hypothetical protein